MPQQRKAPEEVRSHDLPFDVPDDLHEWAYLDLQRAVAPQPLNACQQPTRWGEQCPTRPTRLARALDTIEILYHAEFSAAANTERHVCSTHGKALERRGWEVVPL